MEEFLFYEAVVSWLEKLKGVIYSMTVDDSVTSDSPAK
jgi:hypothetical protein